MKKQAVKVGDKDLKYSKLATSMSPDDPSKFELSSTTKPKTGIENTPGVLEKRVRTPNTSQVGFGPAGSFMT